MVATLHAISRATLTMSRSDLVPWPIWRRSNSAAFGVNRASTEPRLRSMRSCTTWHRHVVGAAADVQDQTDLQNRPSQWTAAFARR
jgi:hypothetical protein